MISVVASDNLSQWFCWNQHIPSITPSKCFWKLAGSGENKTKYSRERLWTLHFCWL